MKLALLLLLAVACHPVHKQDERIAKELKAIWATRGPGLDRPPCPDVDAKRTRVDALIQLAADASRQWPKYDRPLPETLAQRLRELAIAPEAAADFRCLLADPGSKPNAWAMLGLIAALLEHRAELTDDWPPVVVALRMYAGAPAMQYIYFFGAAFVMERATQLAASHPPPAALVPELVAAAHAGTMTQATLCAGEKEELLAHGANMFFNHAPELRSELIARYGAELAPLYDEPQPMLSYAAWTAYRAVYELVSNDCATTPPAELVKRAQPMLELVKAEDPNLGMLLEVAIGRIDTYGRLRAAETAFVAAMK